jgi:drug/metabolite transporter (DMT)-like permease
MVTLALLVLVSGQPMFGYSPAAYGWMLALALVPQLVGHSTLNWALRHLSATYVSIVTLSEPIGAGILAYIILGEVVSGSTALGGAMTLAGIYIASRAEMRVARRMAVEG